MDDLEIAKRLVRTENSARSRGIEFNLSFNTLKNILNSKRCYYSGELIQTEDESLDNYLTLERLDSTKGYVEGNVVACSKILNLKKANLTFEDIKMFYEKLKDKF